MISQLAGRLVARELDRVEIMTSGGVGYECLIPLSVYESLPKEGEQVSLHTHLAVREDAWQLFGFQSAYERSVFQRLLVAKGVGPALALGILSSLSADRVVRALREKDVATLMRVPRVGRKKAEQIILDLADKIDTVGGASSESGAGASSPMTSDAVRALTSLGYPQADAERAVKNAVERGGANDVAALVRAALAVLTGK
jgi:Holliday junction DNA helicase RuvA